MVGPLPTVDTSSVGPLPTVDASSGTSSIQDSSGRTSTTTNGIRLTRRWFLSDAVSTDTEGTNGHGHPLLHASDTRLTDGGTADEGPSLGGFEAVVRRARSLAVDAILYAGNLFDDRVPDERTLDRLEDELDAIHTDGIRLYYVAGRRDVAGNRNPWDAEGLGDHPAVEHLTLRPTDVGGDVALFGIDYRPSDAFADVIRTTGGSFTPASGVAHQILAVHQSVAPSRRSSRRTPISR